jgi:hypothetical protein
MPLDEIVQFMNELMDARGIPETGHARGVMKEHLAEAIADYVMERAVARLSADDLDELKHVRPLTPDASHEFVATHIPNFAEFLRSVIREFKDCYLTDERAMLKPEYRWLLQLRQ